MSPNTTHDRAFGVNIIGVNIAIYRCPDTETETTENESENVEPETEEDTPAERLKKLDELKDQNLISDEEYQQKRSEILDSI